jgi:FMN phosphatase YigB (HAD superfamily)
MIDMKNKVILVDCDGVLLDWEYAFHVWIERHGHTAVDGALALYKIDERYGIGQQQAKMLIRMFNESAAIGYLPPLRDAMHYVRKLHEEHGYVFHAITSLSNDPNAQHLRTKNLKRLFGESAFERFVYLDTGADKDEVLKEYHGSNCYWVEDKPENCEVGLRFGLDSIIMNHAYNSSYTGSLRVYNWKDLYELITG